MHKHEEGGDKARNTQAERRRRVDIKNRGGAGKCGRFPPPARCQSEGLHSKSTRGTFSAGLWVDVVGKRQHETAVRNPADRKRPYQDRRARTRCPRCLIVGLLGCYCCVATTTKSAPPGCFLFTRIPELRRRRKQRFKGQSKRVYVWACPACVCLASSIELCNRCYKTATNVPWHAPHLSR